METFYVRHTKGLAIDEATRERLWREDRIAIHFPEVIDTQERSARGKIGKEDNRSLSLDDAPPKSVGPLRTLLRIGENGGYVCAEHFGHDECLIGRVDPGTPIELVDGVWAPEECPEGRVAVLKSLVLKNARRISASRSAVFLVGRPRQGTISRWKVVGDTIRHLVERTPVPRTFRSLSTGQQETLCAEFLRLEAAREAGLPVLAHLMLPVGRTMKDLDILGLAEDGRYLFGQVTNHGLAQAGEKLARLASYLGVDGGHGVLFCDHDRIARADSIWVFPVDEAFRRFGASAQGRVWMESAYGATERSRSTDR